MRVGASAAGLVAGFAADRLLGDPRRGHPVALFGRAAGGLERRMWADSRVRGCAYAAACVAVPVGLGVLGHACTQRTASGRFVLVAATTWAVIGGEGLAREGLAMSVLLSDEDLQGARRRLCHLCGRDPSQLGKDGLARATVESVAENTSDAVVAPLLWGALAGVPGLLAYRALNTLDAMVGHRSSRYAKFGWASARADDVVTLLPARATALLAGALAPAVGGRPRDAFRAWRCDAGRHPSPNAGPVEAAFAGALGLRLGGTNVYDGRADHRGFLGDGRPPGVPDIARVVLLSRLVGAGAVSLAVLTSAVVHGRVRTGGSR